MQEPRLITSDQIKKNHADVRLTYCNVYTLWGVSHRPANVVVYIQIPKLSDFAISTALHRCSIFCTPFLANFGKIVALAGM